MPWQNVSFPTSSATLAFELLVAVPGIVLVLLLYTPQLRHRKVRAKLSHRLHQHVIAQLPWVLDIQRNHHWSLDVLTRISAFTVTTEFFMSFLPAMYWLGLRDECVAITVGLALCTLVNSGWKDYLGSPRPWFACSPAIRHQLRVLEHNGEVEYGAPSLHTSVSLFFGTYLATLAAAALRSQCGLWGAIEGLDPDPRSESGSMHGAWLDFDSLVADGGGGGAISGGRSATAGLWLGRALQAMGGAGDGGLQAPSNGMNDRLGALLQHCCASPSTTAAVCMAFIACALAWSVWIAWSRLYIGVHTPLDLALGACLGAALCAAWGAVAPRYSAALRTAPGPTLAVHLAANIAMLAFYPRPRKHTTSYIPSVVFSSAAFGLTAGHVAPPGTVRRLAAAAPQAPLAALRAAGAPLRIVVGLAVIATFLVTLKPLLVAALPRLLGAAPRRLRRLWQPPISWVSAGESEAELVHAAQPYVLHSGAGRRPPSEDGFISRPLSSHIPLNPPCLQRLSPGHSRRSGDAVAAAGGLNNAVIVELSASQPGLQQQVGAAAVEAMVQVLRKQKLPARRSPRFHVAAVVEEGEEEESAKPPATLDVTAHILASSGAGGSTQRQLQQHQSDTWTAECSEQDSEHLSVQTGAQTARACDRRHGCSWISQRGMHLDHGIGDKSANSPSSHAPLPNSPSLQSSCATTNALVTAEEQRQQRQRNCNGGLQAASHLQEQGQKQAHSTEHPLSSAQQHCEEEVWSPSRHVSIPAAEAAEEVWSPGSSTGGPGGRVKSMGEGRQRECIRYKPDGYPWDADIARRYILYSLTTMVVALYGRLTTPPYFT